MAKDSEKNIKDRIKKVVPQNEWLVNVTKSLGFASLDVVKELIPNTYSTADWNKDFVMSATEMAKNIRDNNGIRNAFNRQFGNLPQVKAAKKVRENALADLRSGKLYNQNRELGLNDDGEFDFSFDDDSGPIFIDDDGSGDDGDYTESNDNANKPPVTIINTMPLAKTISASTEANITTMNAIAEQNMAVESEKIMLTKQTFNITMNALDTINSNLSLLVQFNSDSTAKYQAAALKYFEQSLEFMKPPAEEEKIVNKFLNPFTAEGGLKLDEYFGVVKENLKQIKDENLILSSISDFFTNPEMIEALSKNPIGMLMTMGMKKMIPKSIKKSLNGLDKNVNAILPALLARINTFEDSDDPLLQTLNKVFGYKQKLSYDVDLGSYKKDAVAWDGESKKALVEVIPSYLRRIESALTGDDERIFNYSTGKFTDINDIKKKYDEKLSDVETSGFYSVKSEINDVVNKLNLSSAARDQFDKDLVEYFRAMTKKGSLIRHTNRKNADGQDIDEFALEGLFDFDVDRTNLMKRVLSLLPRDILTEMGSTAITDSRERTQKYLDEVRENPNLSGYSYMHNDLDKDGKMRYNRYRDGQKDGFGLTQLDYLRDIRAALIHGIRVFPKYYDEDLFGPPNKDILERESNEKKERRERLRREAKKNAPTPKATDDGISTSDAANLSDDKWNELKPQKEKSDNTLANNLDKLNDKVSDAVFDLLYGSDNYKDIANDKLMKLLKAREEGKSIFSTVKGMFGDTIKAFKSYFTGQAYITSDGVKVEGRADNMLEKIKGFFTGTKDKLVGKDGEEGMLQKFAKDFMDGYQKFKVSLFGEKKLSEMQDTSKETFQSLMQKVKERLPKAAGHGFAAAMVKTMFASNLGILGSFLLPGGPLGAALTGTTIGFLRQSETFNRYMFGEKDADGNRVGGLISKAWQDKYSEYKDSIKKGAGLGLLASLVLPGGPIAGAMLGIGTSIAAKNESFQEFLYGKDYKDQDKKSLMNGTFGKVFKSMAGEESDPGLAAFLGAGGVGIGIAQGVGLLPSFLLPGGPIMGAMLGLAGGIAASSNKFQEFLLGEKDVDGKRYGGLLTKAANWFSLTFAQPLKLKFTEFNDFLYGMLRKNIFDPLARSFEPIVHGVKNVFINAKDSLVDAFTNITHPIVKAFKENIIDPISKVVKKAILNPIQWLLKKTFGLMTKTLVGIITSPISIAGRLADKYNEYSAVRQEKFRRRREYDKNTAKEDRNYYDRKRAGKLTKEEKKEAITKGVSYRKGKTWGEKKKEQKDAYKEEMAKRKDRRQKMQEQYEEDLKFAKENGFKFRSKKQQEKREQELKEKERWIQEQQLMQAQDSNTKLEKISDNVVNIADYQNKREDKIINKMEDLGQKIIDIFNKVTGKSKKKSNENKSDSKDESSVKGKIIDITNRLRKDGKSHKDGLDEVPKDGYIAELHEGEMVVPKKPAGKLRKMMNKAGKGFKGLTDVLAEVSEDDRRDRGDNALGLSDAEADRAKELEDRGRRESILQRTKNKIKEHIPTGEQVLDYIAERPALSNIAVKGLRGTSSVIRGVVNGADKVIGGMNKAARIASMIGMGAPISSIASMFGMGSTATGIEGEDDALGLTDDQEDRIKELEDRERYENASRKNIDFIQEQVELKDKEKAERKWRDKLLSTITGVGSVVSTAGTSLFDLLGKGFDLFKNGISNLLSGLGGLAGPLAALGGVLAWNNYKNSEEYITSRTDVDNDGDGQGDFIYDNTDVNIARGYISARKPLVINPLKKIKNKFIDPTVNSGKNMYNGIKSGASKIYNSKIGQKTLQPIGNKLKKGKEYIFGTKPVKAATNTADNVIDFTQAKLAKEAAKNGSGKVVKKAVGETVENAAGSKGLIHKLLDMAKLAINAIGNKLAQKFPTITTKMAGFADEILEIIVRNSDGIIKKFTKKITTFITRVGAGASTAFTLDIIFGACDLVSGATAGNAGNLFGVSPENVDLKMRIISSVLQVVTNFNALGVIGLINEITSAMFNFNFLRSLATGIYNLISDVDLTNRITAKQIDSCKSIEDALAIMGINDPSEIAKLKNSDGTWKNFADVENEELGGVVSPTEQMELARLQYNLENGTKLSSQAFIDKESKTLGSKFFDATKKLFTTDSSEQKINKLENKAQEKRDKAAEHEAKAAKSNNIFSKGWNKAMAFLNNTSADRKLKKAEKVKTKAAKKKAKAEQKLAKHEAKAATSTGISKWYHNWRAKKNAKKIEKYTINENGVVTPTQSGGANISPEQEKINEANANILSPEEVLLLNDIPEGEIMYDGYGNMYDHNGNYIGNENLIGDAGMGDGEDILAPNATNYPVEYKTSKKDDSKLKKAAKVSLAVMFPGAAALYAGVKAGKKLFGKKEKPEDYQMVPVLDAEGNIISYTKQPIDETTEIKGYGKESLQVGEISKTTQVIPQMDEKGNVVSYTTVDKKSSKSKSWLSRLGSAVGSFFGIGGSTSNSSTVDNSSSVDNSVTGDTNTYNTYNGSTSEIDTSAFGPLTDAINDLIGTQGNNNIDKDGNVKTGGGILRAIMDPMGYLVNNLVSLGVETYEDKTGKEVDMKKINQGISIFNMIRNPFGYLQSLVKGKMDPDGDGKNDKTLKEGLKEVYNDGKEKVIKAKDWTVDKYNTIKDWHTDKYNTAKDWTVDKYNTAKDWTVDKYNTAKDWTVDKYNKGKKWVNRQAEMSDDVADIMMGDNSANAGFLSTAITMGSKAPTALWNMLAPEEYKLSEEVLPNFVASMINDFIVTPFREFKGPIVEKFNETKEKVIGWVDGVKTNIINWFTDTIKDPFINWFEEKKEILIEYKDKAVAWMKDTKDAIFNWFGENIAEPFKDWFEEKKEILIELKDQAVTWVKDTKDKVVEWFGENIKEPFKKWYEKTKSKLIKIKDKAVTWVKDTKDKIFEWFGENIKEPFTNWAIKKKKQITELKNKAVDWVKDTKDKVFEWFGENVKEPFIKWASEKKDKITEMYNSAKSWIGGVKDKVVEGFNKYIKEPAEEALKPLTDGIGKAWSSLKTAFSPLSELFSAVGNGDWGAVYSFITGKSKSASENVNASADNDRFHGATNTKSLDQQVKPKNYIFNENDANYTGKDAGRTDGGLKDKGNTHNFPFYAQADNRWGKDRIGNASMADSGCGPTATAMVMTHLTGQHITPDTMAKIGKEYLPGYTSYNYFPEVADKFNLNYAEANDAASIKARLMSGQPILLSGYDNSNGKMTPYTSKGHIVVATGIDGNNVQINDPRGPEYSGSYSLNNVVKGLKRGIVLSSTKDTKKVGLPTSGLYSSIHDMNGQYDYNGDLPTDDTMENLGGDVGQIKLWEKVVGYAKAFKEKLKYVYGSKAIDNNGMTTDCSGFTKHVMSRCGINIPAGSANQKNAGTGVSPSQAQAGDLVVWKGHVGLVIDSNKNMIDAGSGSVPKIRSYETDYWRSRGSYVIRRVIDPNKMVSAKVDNYHTGIGFSGVVGSQGGGDLNGGGTTGGATDGTTGGTNTVEAPAPQVEMFGPFAELEKIGNAMIGAMYNGKSYQEMYDSLYAQPVVSTDSTTGGTTGGDSSSGSTDISGISDTATAVWKFFTGKGYNKYATAGIMGNLQQESGMDPTRKQSGGGPGRGIAQWTVSEGRFKGLQSHAQSKGKDWTDLQSQLEWIDLELGGKDSTTANILKKNYGGLSGLKNASSTKWAVEAFEKSFERAGKPMWEKRYNYADNFYNKFSSAGAGTELDGNAGGGFNMATSAESAPASGIPTTMNGWAYYKQGDPKWQEDINGKKIGPSGCGMASHAMMLTTMFGKQVTPVTVGKWARSNGYWSSGMSWDMPSAVARKLGLSITKSETNGNGLGSSSLSNIKSQIKSGYPVVLSGKGNSSSYDTPFTTGGHIVLAVGVDGSGNVIINDPRDPKRTKAYTDNGILNIGTGLRGYWAFDKSSGASLPEDWSSGDYSGGSSGGTSGGTTGGTTVEAAPQLDILGSFAGLEKAGNNMIASVFNGEKVDMYATSAPVEGTTGGTTGGTTNGGGTGSVNIDETLMFSGTDGFFKALSGAAMNTYNQYKNIFPSTILAQAALESAWGKSKVAQSDKNLFGIKWTGRHNPLITVEKGRNCPGGEQGGARPYNKYKSFGDSVLDHGWFLNNNGSRYNATLNAKTPSEQITALGKSGYAESGSYGSKLQSMVNKYNLTQYNSGAGNGDGDGNTYLITPGGDAGKGDGVKASYSKSVINNAGVNKTNVETQREIEAINRKINVAVNNINTSDPNVYAEILKLIMQELQAINSNTAATASGVNDIKIVSANEPVSNVTTADVYNSGKKTTTRQKINTATGYNMARQIAGYQK